MRLPSGGGLGETAQYVKGIEKWKNVVLAEVVAIKRGSFIMAILNVPNVTRK